MNMLSAIKHEAKEIGLVTLYFFLCFGVVLTLANLLLADYQIQTYAVSAAVIAALVVAKVVIILDKTHAGTSFDAEHPLLVAATYKALIYSLATVAVLSLERAIHVYRESENGTFGHAIVETWTHRHRDLILAKSLMIGLAFLGYHLYAGLDRRLGEGSLRRMVLRRSRPAEK